MAERSGAQNNYFFATTFERYQVQLQLLENLEAEMKSDGVTVEKQYVKGRKNLYTNPCITAYNKTTDSANKTVTTLLKIVNGWKKEEATAQEVDPLLAIINGADELDE